MLRRAPLVMAASLLLFVVGACTLSTAGIDSGEASGTTGSTSTAGNGGAGGALSTTSTTATASTTGTGGAAPCSSDADCPLPSMCVKYTCPAGACVPTFAPAGTPVMGAPPGPCKKLVCDGAGAPAVKDDDVQMPDDMNACTTDVCESGKPKHAQLPNGTPCGGGLACKDGQCAGCTDLAQCPMGDTCKLATCAVGACGFDVVTPNGKTCAPPSTECFESSLCAAGACVPMAKPAAIFSDGANGNCKSASCDGAGMFAIVNDDNDVSPDGNSGDCTVPSCDGGVPGTKPAADGQACGLAGQHCCAGACQYAACCPVAMKCNNTCCQQNQVCDGNFCCGQDKVCGGKCCDPVFGVTCLANTTCCFNNNVCGAKCCAFGQQCNNGNCQ
ncbi:MAG: hypothetical protein ABI193_12975 [Minicystis sp.]